MTHKEVEDINWATAPLSWQPLIEKEVNKNKDAESNKAITACCRTLLGFNTGSGLITLAATKICYPYHPQNKLNSKHCQIKFFTKTSHSTVTSQMQVEQSSPAREKVSPSLYSRPSTVHTTGHTGQHWPAGVVGDAQLTAGHSVLSHVTDPSCKKQQCA